LPVYLTFLDHAVASTAEALRLLSGEERKSEPKREAPKLALAIQQGHMAVEKLLKHVVSVVDPYLLLEQINSKFLRDLRKEVRSQELPTIFATRAHLVSSNAEQAWGVLKEVIGPAIDADTASSFEAALKGLSILRNQAQHGELYGEFHEAVNVLKRTFSKLPAVSSVVCPEFLQLLEEKHLTQYAELRAIEQAVDAAWWALRAFLMKGKGKRIKIPLTIHVTIRPNIPTVDLTISRHGGSTLGYIPSSPGKGESGLSLSAEVEMERVSGLFGKIITPEQATERDAARRQVTRRRAVTTPIPLALAVAPATPQAPPGGLGGLGLGGLLGIRRTLIGDAFKDWYTQEQAYIEKNGMPPLEDGTLELDVATAWITVPLGRKSEKHITGDVILQNCRLIVESRKPRGRLTGFLFPRVSTGEIQPITVDGKIWLTSEFVIKDNPSELLPLGTVIRFFRGEVQLTLPAPLGGVQTQQ